MESMTDLQQHIRKRLTEIEDLDERKDAREILLEGLVPIFERMEKRYLDLENQIKREIEIPNEKYAVSMTVITQKDYDPINGTLYPVVPALLQEDKEQEKEPEEDGAEDTASDKDTGETGTKTGQEADTVFVYMCGAVAAPGVYELKKIGRAHV